MAHFWYGGNSYSSWDLSSTDNWSTVSGTTFLGTMTGTTTLTVSGVAGSALAIGKQVRRQSTGELIGTIVSGSGTSWVLDFTGVYTNEPMGAGTPVAAAPSDTDDVVFDANSGSINFIVKTSFVAQCKNFTVSISTAGRCTFEGELLDGEIEAYGSVSINAATTISTSSPVNLLLAAETGAITIATNAVKFKDIKVDPFFTGATSFTLSSALTAQSLYIGDAPFNTNGQTVILTTQYHGGIDTFFEATGSLPIAFGASAINIGTSASETPDSLASLIFNFFGGTLTAGTSTITIGSTSTTNTNYCNFNVDSFSPLTFRTLVINGVGAAILGSVTFSNGLTKNAVTNNSYLRLDDNVSVTAGAFSLIGTATSRLLVLSNTARTPRTFTLTGTGSRALSYVSFLDISLVFSSPVGGTSVGDMGGNTGITFTPAVTRYLVLGGANKDFSSTSAWSATSGGATGATSPLPQDSVIANAASGLGQLNIDSLYVGTSFTTTGFTGTMICTLNPNAPLYVLGQPVDAASFIANLGVLLTYRFNSNINLANSYSNGIYIDGGSATASLSSNTTVSGVIRVLSGGFNTNSNNLSASILSSVGTDVGAYQDNSIAANTYSFGSSLITLFGVFPLLFLVPDVVNAGTSTINLTSTAPTVGFTLNNKTFYNFKFTPGASQVRYSGLSGSQFNNITLDPHTALVLIDLTPGTTTTVASMNIASAKGAGVIVGVNLTSNSAISTNATLAIGSNVVTDFAAYVGITKSGASSLIARGAADLGANVGITFQQHSVIAFSGSGPASFTVPNNFSGSSYMLVVGAGGGAGKRSLNTTSAGGGGSGAVAVVSNLNISAGQTIYLNSPVGGAGATSSGSGGSPANAWINIAANIPPSLVTDGAFADSGNGSTNGSTTGGAGGSFSSSLGNIRAGGITGGSGSTSGGGGSSAGSLLFRVGKAGGSGNGGGAGGASPQFLGVNGAGLGGGTGAAFGVSPGGTGGAGGSFPVAGGNGAAGTSVGGGGGGSSSASNVNSAIGGNGASGSQWTYKSLNGVAGSGTIGYGGAGGGGGGTSNLSNLNSSGGRGGNGSVGAGGGGGGRGTTSGGVTGDGGDGGPSMVLFVYVENRGGNFATIIG